MSDKVTVKQTINKATSIYKIEHITVGKPGSEQYRHAFELADQLGLKHPDCIEHVFPTYADEQCTQRIFSALKNEKALIAALV
ncbi:hypothetical protein FJMB80155_p10030 (plasmid) [Escherichia coli]|jgi:hypothetical protein|nr:hypothetical protein [Escherichia coli]BCX41510.1 hypothetical protein FJMB80155_p10030 [Escherichia coli]